MGSQIRRILLVKPSALGDVCRSMPALASLRGAFPDARIDWLVQDDFADAVRAHPALAGAIAFPRRTWRRWWTPGSIAGVRAFARAIRENGYDLAIDLQGLFRSGLFLWASRAPRRVGWRDAREFAWLGANERHARRGGPDATDCMLALLEDAGVAPERDPRLHVPAEAAAAWQQVRDRAGVREGFVALAPTSRWASKRWPAERWKALAGRVASAGRQVVMLGAPGEMAQVRAAMPESGAVDLCGAMPLGAWLACLRDAAAVVANDSAAVHAAVGLGRPLVGIYGATDPRAVGPYRRSESVVAPPGPAPVDPHAYRDARLVQRMHLVSVDVVERRLSEELSRGPRW